MHRIRLSAFAGTAQKPTVLAFSEEPPRQWAQALRSARFRVVVDRRQSMIPPVAYVYAPTVIVLDAQGRIASADEAVDGQASTKTPEARS